MLKYRSRHYKYADQAVLQVEWETVRDDKTGLFLDGGAYLL